MKAVTSPALDKLVDEIQCMPKLGNSPGSVTRPFMQTVGQLPQLDQVAHDIIHLTDMHILNIKVLVL